MNGKAVVFIKIAGCCLAFFCVVGFLLTDPAISIAWVRIALLLGASVGLACLIQQKAEFYLPSMYVFIIFLLMPAIAWPGYYSYLRVFHVYKGGFLNIPYALEHWLLGVFFFLVGVLAAHAAVERCFKAAIRPRAGYLTWRWDRYQLLLTVLTIVSAASLVVSLTRIGYIPILRGGIEFERFAYLDSVGDWTYKLSRLWLLVYFFSFVGIVRQFGMRRRILHPDNKGLILLVVLSLFALSVYGDRYHLFIAFFFAVILINKLVRRIHLSYFLLILTGTLLLSGLVFIMRGASLQNPHVAFWDSFIIPVFSEWREFAYVVQSFPEPYFFRGKTFLSAAAPLLPSVVWELFDVNKHELMGFSSAGVMKELFRHHAGIRIGILGEAYINFGTAGIAWISTAAGALFGLLEAGFIKTEKYGVRETILAFILSCLIFLPMAQTDAVVIVIVFNMYFFLLAAFFFAHTTGRPEA